MARVLVREPRPSDFRDIAATNSSFYPEAEADPSFGLTLYRSVPSPKSDRRWFSKALKNMAAGNVVMRVAVADSHVIGWCDVTRRVPGSAVDHRGELGIGVRKEFRGQGIGAALMKSALEGCKGKFEIIELDVLTTNQRAIKLYKSFGFKKCGTLPSALKRAGRYFDDDFMYLKL